MNERNFDALENLRPVAAKHNLTEAECGLRWITHHPALKKGLGDALIVDASRTSQLEENLANLEKGPLPEDVVQALDNG
jgi:aflatoxin B1 aldehyde reductase